MTKEAQLNQNIEQMDFGLTAFFQVPWAFRQNLLFFYPLLLLLQGFRGKSWLKSKSIKYVDV